MSASRWQKRVSWLFFLLGVVLLFKLLQDVGVAHVLEAINRLKMNMIYVLLLPLSWTLIQSYAWWRVIYDEGERVKFRHVFFAKLAGEAINTVTPVSFLGGDPYRIFVLQKNASKTESASSVVIDRTMYTLAVVVVLMITLIAAWFYLPLPGVWRVLFPVFTALFFAFIVAIIVLQRRGLFSTLAELAAKQRFGRKKLQSMAASFNNLDLQIAKFYQKSRSHFFEVLTLQVLGRLMGVVEIYLIAQFLGTGITLTECLFLTSLTILINIVFVFIPGSMGIMESGYGALFGMIGEPQALGVAIQLIRRIRTLFWVGVGLLVIFITGKYR